MIPRALRARAATLPTDLVLLGFVIAVVVVATSFSYAIPEGLATASDAVRMRFRDELVTPAALITAMAAALYAAFDYTLDLKNGVVARDATTQRRRAVLGSRVVVAALGGGVVGIACATGITAAAALAGAGWMPDPTLLLRAAAAGLLAATWGFAVAVLVRRHLVALFAVPASLGLAVPLGAVAPQASAWLPLPAIIGTVGGDQNVLARHEIAVAPSVVAAAWLVVVAGVAAIRFCTRDIT